MAIPFINPNAFASQMFTTLNSPQQFDANPYKPQANNNAVQDDNPLAKLLAMMSAGMQSGGSQGLQFGAGGAQGGNSCSCCSGQTNQLKFS